MSLERIGERVGVLEQRARQCDKNIGRVELRLNAHSGEIRRIVATIDHAKGWVAAAVFFTSLIGSATGGAIVFALYKYLG